MRITLPGSLALCLLAAAAAAADQAQLVIRNGPPNEDVQITTPAGATTARTDAAGALTALLELGNLGKPAVRVDECPAQPDRVTFGDPATTCENGRTPDGCKCREVFGLMLPLGERSMLLDWSQGTITLAEVVDSLIKHRDAIGPEAFALAWVFGAGGESSMFPSEECRPIPGFTATCDLDKSGFDVMFLGELEFLPWLAAGVSFERIHGVTLERDLQSIDTPGLTGEVRDAHFDPVMGAFYLRPTLRIGSSVDLYAQAGIARWKADSGNRTTLRFEDQVLEETTVQEDSGWSPLVGAGVNLWPGSRVGLRFGWEYAKLKKEEANIDTSMHNVMAAVLLKLGGR
jgi:opacity protein-like surface antigen